jgi:DNA-binding PadR family transcriptional regulator
MKPRSAYLYVLTALGQAPSHGLGVAENVAEFTHGEMIIGPGTLYRCLNDLQAEGFIERTPPPESCDNPHRKYYRITSSGREVLARDIQGLDALVRTAKERLSRFHPAPVR